MKYQIIASRGASVMLISLTRPKVPSQDWKAFLYHTIRKTWQPVGEEAFKFGYWDEAFGEIELDLDPNKENYPK